MIESWRICHPKYAQNHLQIMSGEGAYINGGRWNSKGMGVVYLGSSLALSALEILVGLNSLRILNQYKKLEVSFEEHQLDYVTSSELPIDWDRPNMKSRVQATGDAWLRSKSSLALKVPSAVVQGEYNYLINPLHEDFDKLVLGEISDFRFDPRLQI